MPVPASQVFRMYDARPLQDPNTGLRFETRDELRAQMDKHFAKAKQGKGRGAPPPCRLWMASATAWVKGKPGAELARSMDVFEDAAGAGKGDEAAEAVELPVMPAPAGVTRLTCFQCGEEVCADAYA